jgi:hypothetical protein
MHGLPSDPVSGGPSQITEMRVGHKDDNGNFVNPTVTINGGRTISGRSLINDRAICPQVQEHVPDSEDIRTLRAVLNTLGDGFVEPIDMTNVCKVKADPEDTPDDWAWQTSITLRSSCVERKSLRRMSRSQQRPTPRQASSFSKASVVTSAMWSR